MLNRRSSKIISFIDICISSQNLGLSLLLASGLNTHFTKKTETIRRISPQVSTKMSTYILCVLTASTDEISILLSISPSLFAGSQPSCLTKDVSPPILFSISSTINFSLTVESFLSGCKHAIICPIFNRKKLLVLTPLILPTPFLCSPVQHIFCLSLLPFLIVSWIYSIKLLPSTLH